MHECGVSTFEPNREITESHQANWGQFYDFAVGGVIPTDVDQLDRFRAYAHMDAYERCGQPGTAQYEWFAHKDGGYIREADLTNASHKASRQAWLLSPDDLAYNKRILAAETFDQLPDSLRNGIRPTADTPQMFAAIQGCAVAKVRLHNSIRVREMWEARPRNMFRSVIATSESRPDRSLQRPRRYGESIVRTVARGTATVRTVDRPEQREAPVPVPAAAEVNTAPRPGVRGAIKAAAALIMRRLRTSN